MSSYQRTDTVGEPQNFHALANEMPIPMWASDRDGQLTWFNKNWLEYHGRDFEQELGEGWLQNVHPQDLPHCISQLDIACREEEPFEMTYRSRNADGEYRWILSKGIPMMPQSQFGGFVGSIVDISKSKQDQVRLESEQALLRNLVHLNDRDRQMMSHEIHNGILQYLVASTLTLESMDNDSCDESNAAKISEIRSYLEQAVDEGHRLINAFYPRVIMNNLDAYDAIQLLIRDTKSTGIQVEYEGPGEEALATIDANPIQKGNLCRIIQELLRNVERHSQADTVKLTIRCDATTIELEVADNGIGFDPKQIPELCEGLARLHDRVRIYSGEFGIVSRKGEGTTASVRMQTVRDQQQSPC